MLLMRLQLHGCSDLERLDLFDRLIDDNSHRFAVIPAFPRVGIFFPAFRHRKGHGIALKHTLLLFRFYFGFFPHYFLTFYFLASMHGTPS